MTSFRPLDRWQRCAMAGLFAAGALSASRAARADCASPAASIRWTYPDDATRSVPPNVVFWVVPEDGDAEVEVDGVPLSPLGDSLAERRQFVADAPLADGTHELVARVTAQRSDGAGNVREEQDERRVRFEVAAEPERHAAVSIRSVSVYPFKFSYVDGTIISPPDDKYDPECTQLATPLGWSCDDIIPSSFTRIGYEGTGDAIAYLVQGNTLVPAGCASYWITWGFSGSSRYSVAPVLPTGVGDESVFTGPVEVLTLEQAAPDRFSHPSACAIGFGRRAPSALAAAAALALVACRLRRRR